MQAAHIRTWRRFIALSVLFVPLVAFLRELIVRWQVALDAPAGNDLPWLAAASAVAFLVTSRYLCEFLSFLGLLEDNYPTTPAGQRAHRRRRPYYALVWLTKPILFYLVACFLVDPTMARQWQWLYATSIVIVIHSFAFSKFKQWVRRRNHAEKYCFIVPDSVS